MGASTLVLFQHRKQNRERQILAILFLGLPVSGWWVSSGGDPEDSKMLPPSPR